MPHLVISGRAYINNDMITKLHNDPSRLLISEVDKNEFLKLPLWVSHGKIPKYKKSVVGKLSTVDIENNNVLITGVINPQYAHLPDEGYNSLSLRYKNIGIIVDGKPSIKRVYKELSICKQPRIDGCTFEIINSFSKEKNILEEIFLNFKMSVTPETPNIDQNKQEEQKVTPQNIQEQPKNDSTQNGKESQSTDISTFAKAKVSSYSDAECRLLLEKLAEKEIENAKRIEEEQRQKERNEMLEREKSIKELMVKSGMAPDENVVKSISKDPSFLSILEVIQKKSEQDMLNNKKEMEKKEMEFQNNKKELESQKRKLEELENLIVSQKKQKQENVKSDILSQFSESIRSYQSYLGKDTPNSNQQQKQKQLKEEMAFSKDGNEGSEVLKMWCRDRDEFLSVTDVHAKSNELFKKAKESIYNQSNN